MPNFTATPSTITRLAIINQLAAISPFSNFNGGNIDIETTLNHKYGVFDEDPDPSNPPVDPHLPGTNIPRLNYFGIGINGASGGAPYIPKSTNGDLYKPVPVRVIKLNHDENDEDNEGNVFDRSKYRMRNVRTVGGTPYACYWLKMIDWDEVDTDTVRFAEVTPGTPPVAMSAPYKSIDINPVENEDTTPTSQVIAYLTGLLEITNKEVSEAFDKLSSELNLPNSNMQISEIGIYSGIETPGVDLIDENGDVIAGKSYTESAYTQLAFHRCSTGFDLQTAGASYREEVNLESSNLSLL